MFKYEIDVFESERGWGQTWWVEKFDTPEAAQKRIDEINAQNTAPVAPDYYVAAVNNIRVVKDN